MNCLKVGFLSWSLFLFGSTVLFAQAPEPIDYQNRSPKSIQTGASTLILNLGIGFPSGEFEDKEEGGGAKNGFGIGVEFQYNITESFYAGVIYRNQTNPVDEAAMQRSMAAVVSELTMLGIFPPGSAAQSTSTDNWKLNSYMLGVGTISELNNKDIKVYTKMMLGLCSGSSPSVQTMVTNTHNNYEDFTINMLSGDANNFAALFGLGLRIHAGKSVDLFVSGDYFTTNLEFEDVRVELLGQYSPPQTLKQQVDIMSLSVGLIFKL